MTSNPSSNHGFALVFDSQNEFGASEAPFGKPRLVVTYTRGPLPGGGDVSILDLMAGKGNGGIDATLVNHGDAPVSGLKAAWTVSDGLEGTSVDLGGPIAPGQSKVIHYDASPRGDATDERVGAIRLSLSGGDTDKHLADKSMTLYPNGEEVTIMVDQGLAAKFADVESARGRGLANWAQSEIEAFNDLYLSRSRYSISPDGARVRVRLSRVMVTGSTIDTAAPTGASVAADAADLAATWPDPAFLRRLALALGVPDLAQTEIGLPNTPGALPFDIAGRSWFPGLSGGGDTRFDGALQSAFNFMEAAFSDPAVETVPKEPSGLLALSDVAALQALIGKTGPARHPIPVFPKLCLVKATNGGSARAPAPEMSALLPTPPRKARRALPAFTLKTRLASGLLLLPNKASPSGSEIAVRDRRSR